MSGIEYYRKKRNITQEELAKQLGVTQGAVLHWEKGRAKPKIAHLLRMSKLLGVGMEELLEAEIHEDDEKIGI